MGKRKLWTPTFTDGGVLIPLTQGKFAVIDEADLPVVRPYKWQAHQSSPTKWYASHNSFYMHRMILGLKRGERGPDHIDGDGLNNRRSNLRAATHGQNMANRGPKPDSTSHFKGVSWWSGIGRWGAEIKANGVRRHLGQFEDEEEAARAYDAAAKRLHGPYAWLNFPDDV